MENIIASILEKSLVGGAFIYMLYMFVTKFSVTQEKIANTLIKVAKSLDSLDKRMGTLEARVTELEGKKCE